MLRPLRSSLVASHLCSHDVLIVLCNYLNKWLVDASRVWSVAIGRCDHRNDLILLPPPRRAQRHPPAARGQQTRRCVTCDTFTAEPGRHWPENDTKRTSPCVEPATGGHSEVLGKKRRSLYILHLRLFQRFLTKNVYIFKTQCITSTLTGLPLFIYHFYVFFSFCVVPNLIFDLKNACFKLCFYPRHPSL